MHHTLLVLWGKQPCTWSVVAGHGMGFSVHKFLHDLGCCLLPLAATAIVSACGRMDVRGGESLVR
jgi:hypothetical protein